MHLYVNNVEADAKIKRIHKIHTTLFLFGEIKIFVIIARWIDNDDRETVHNVSLAEESIHKSFFVAFYYLQCFRLLICSFFSPHSQRVSSLALPHHLSFILLDG